MKEIARAGKCWSPRRKSSDAEYSAWPATTAIPLVARRTAGWGAGGRDRRRAIHAAASLTAAVFLRCSLQLTALAQNYPSKPVRMSFRSRRWSDDPGAHDGVDDVPKPRPVGVVDNRTARRHHRIDLARSHA